MLLAKKACILLASAFISRTSLFSFPDCHSKAPVSCSSLLLHATAHEHDIPPHFLNGLPVLLRVCQFLPLDCCLSLHASPANFGVSQSSVSSYLPLLSCAQLIYLSLNHQSERQIKTWVALRHVHTHTRKRGELC